MLMFEDIQLILTELGFIHSGRYRKDPNVDIMKERNLLDDLWTHLKGDFYGEVSMRNLKTFISGIMGLRYSWMMLKTSENSRKENSLNRISYDRLPQNLKLLSSHRYDKRKYARHQKKSARTIDNRRSEYNANSQV